MELELGRNLTIEAGGLQNRPDGAVWVTMATLF